MLNLNKELKNFQLMNNINGVRYSTHFYQVSSNQVSNLTNSRYLKKNKVPMYSPKLIKLRKK